MPSSKNYRRKYDQEYKRAKERGEIGTGRNSTNAKQHRARTAASRCGMIVKGKDVDHKRPISKGGSNACSNLRVVSASKNRSFARNSDGSIKSKKA